MGYNAIMNRLKEARFFGAGAFHIAPLGWTPVVKRRTLKMLERAGYVTIPAEYGKCGRSAIGPVTHRYVNEGPRMPGVREFKHRGRLFRLQWADGCFKPFVWEFKAGFLNRDN